MNDLNRKIVIVLLIICFFIIILLASIRPGTAGSHKFGNFVAVCPGHKIVYRELPQNSPGMYAPGVIILDPHVLRQEKLVVQKFVFFHECGQGFVGESEHAADCFAAKHGIRNGWLKETDIEAICLSFVGPATFTHPSGKSRCGNIYRCVSAAKKEIASGKTPDNNISK